MSSRIPHGLFFLPSDSAALALVLTAPRQNMRLLGRLVSPAAASSSFLTTALEFEYFSVVDVRRSRCSCSCCARCSSWSLLERACVRAVLVLVGFPACRVPASLTFPCTAGGPRQNASSGWAVLHFYLHLLILYGRAVRDPLQDAWFSCLAFLGPTYP